MLRFEVRDADGEPLPAIDVDDAEVIIGSAPHAKIRLPASAAEPEHVRVRAADVGDGKTFEIGSFRVRVVPAPAGAVAASPQRTESLARELVRGLLGAGAAPTLEIESGPRTGAKRALAAPESKLVIGRGDEAGWIIEDEDLSRAHVEVRRGWDGAWLRDLGSKNGTRVGGEKMGEAEVELRDGGMIELGKVKVRFRDPAERHLRGASPSTSRSDSSSTSSRSSTSTSTSTSTSSRSSTNERAGSSVVFYGAIVIGLAALAGLGWILAT